MADKVRFANRIAAGINRRLRMFAVVKGLSLSDALTVLLDQALPSVDELSRQMRESEATS